MSGHRRRHYPTAAYQATQAQGQPPIQPQDPQQGFNNGGAYFTPAAAAVAANGGIPQNGYSPVQPDLSIDTATQGLNNLNIAGIPTLPQQQYGQPLPPAAGYTPHQQQFQAPQQNSYGASYGYGASSPAELSQNSRQSLPLNQIYQIDLLRELPPPISDLSLPPPPVILAPNATVIESNQNAITPPDYFRSTLNAVPTTNSLLKKTKLPFALVVRPYTSLHDDVRPVPVVSDTVIARCRRCRTYINPFVQFTEQGRRWRCNLCNLQNDVPQAFDYNRDIGAAANRYERNELNYSVVEFVAPKEYMVRTPQPLVYVFVIDVSVTSIQSGLLATISTTILESLDRIPNKDQRTKIGFLAVDSSLSYFNIPEDSEEGETSIYVVPDLDEPFSPSPDSLLVNLTLARQNIEKLLLNLNSLFAGNVNPSFALGPALKSAHHLIQSIGGKIVAFGSTLPNIGIGQLTIRNEESVYDKPKEASTLLSANNSFYKSFAVDCNKSQVSIEMFLTSASYQDVATLANLPKYTAGQTHYYPAWTASNVEDVTKLSKELSNCLSEDIALEAVLRTRGSSGLRMNAFYGNFFNRSSDLCSFPTFPRDQSYVIEVAIEDNIAKPFVYLQTAVLHTTNYGQRRIRVLTMALPTTSNISEIFASADQLAITNYYTHKAIEKTLFSSLNDARDLLEKHLFDILNVFKKELVSGNISGGSSLMLSANLRMLPLLIHALTKHIGFRGGKVPSDHRANALNLLGSLPLPQLIKYIYPTVYSLHDMPDEVGLPSEDNGEILLPEAKNASAESFERYGLYLINNSTELFLWIGGDAVPELVNDVFGVSDIFQVPIGKSELPALGSDFNQRVGNIIAKVREGDDTVVYQNLYIVRGGSANEPINAANAKEVGPLRLWAASHLIEDRLNKAPSYREFLSATKDKINT